MTDFITMAHGNGGATMQELIRDYFVEAFDNPILSQGEDQARIALQEL
ncbi:MAG: hydrogenase expression/formation protein HypE, partial [Haemophilus parainfluenzae]|nr:hydrogenase expression/formation protein HypE [Haemophilus parainfluenzae]